MDEYKTKVHFETRMGGTGLRNVNIIVDTLKVDGMYITDWRVEGDVEEYEVCRNELLDVAYSSHLHTVGLIDKWLCMSIDGFRERIQEYIVEYYNT